MFGLRIPLLLIYVDDREHLYILDVRATELQQALRESNHQVYVALFESVISA